MKETVTDRGFARFEFLDEYNSKCSLQESSSASVERIWLGVDTDFNGKDCTRMHLNKEQVRALLPILQTFAEE